MISPPSTDSRDHHSHGPNRTSGPVFFQRLRAPTAHPALLITGNYASLDRIPFLFRSFNPIPLSHQRVAPVPESKARNHLRVDFAIAMS
jgi:hypothetical protein